MTAPPLRADLFPAGSLLPATAKTKWAAFFDYVVALLGSTGTAADARAALGAAEVGDNSTITRLSALTSINGTWPGGFKNKIIGGDFTTNPWQRGTSFTNPADGAYTADRYFVSYSCDAVVNVLRTADAPTPAQGGHGTHCLHIDVTTADTSIAAGQFYRLCHRIEGFNAVSFGFGQGGTRYITRSFWHKHTKTGIYCVGVRNGAADRSYVAEYTQEVSDTWEKATITIPVDTNGTWLHDNGVGLHLSFCLACGSTYQTAANAWTAGNYMATANQVNALDSAANNFKIDLDQTEAGQSATDYDVLSASQVLALCQRYHYQLGSATYSVLATAGWFNTTTQATFVTQFPVTMRTTPTFNAYGSGVTALYDNTITAALTSISAAGTYQGSSSLAWVGATSGMTPGKVAMARGDSTSGVTFSAEL